MLDCGLPQAWAHRTAWTVLDTDFQDGQHFFDIWHAWRQDDKRARHLHYVAIAPKLPDLGSATASGGSHAECTNGIVQELASQLSGLTPGFHRILLDKAQLSLTLCLGDVPTMLGEQSFQCDTLIARPPVDKWEIQALARRCKRTTQFWMPAAPGLPAQLHTAGFLLAPSTDGTSALSGRFDPHWTLSNSRTSTSHVQAAPARCAVVGAGISGASVANALARRGWQVTVFDRLAQPAGGASGLPVGLAVPHVSVDDSPRSRMSRYGTHLLQQHAARLLQRGRDWDPTGVCERLPDGSERWHAQACWIKPAQLVRAWLDHAGIRFIGASNVAAMHRLDGLWHLQDSQHQHLGCFETVVVANAMASVELLAGRNAALGLGADVLDKLAALQPVYGTLSHGSLVQPVAGLPTTPVNGHGCFIPLIANGDAGTDTDQWFAGSSFVTDPVLAADGAAQHGANMERLQQLLPLAGLPLVEALARAPVSLWSSTRCVSHDRLPLVGPLQATAGPGLWLCVGMGARGLSFSALCAELLVARLGAEPLPLEFSLSRSLDANRLQRSH